jgi:hypothetical protein
VARSDPELNRGSDLDTVVEILVHTISSEPARFADRPSGLLLSDYIVWIERLSRKRLSDLTYGKITVSKPDSNRVFRCGISSH